MTEVTSLLFNTTSRRALAIVGMIVAIGALFFGVLADDLAAIFLPFAGVVAIVVAWTILSSEHASFNWMKRPLVIALFSAGILGVFFALVFVRPPATIVMFAGVFGAINFPCIGVWTTMGQKLQRILTNPMRLRAFNVSMALLLVGSLYPVLMPQ